VATLSKLENGKQPNPTLFTMLLYVAAIGKRLTFSIREKPPLNLKVNEIRDVALRTRRASKTRRAKVTARGKVEHP
jgi:hypothetical protein